MGHFWFTDMVRLAGVCAGHMWPA